MIEDMRHLAVISALADELQEALTRYNRLSNGISDKDTLLRLRLEQNDLLAEIVRKQRRHLRYMNGEQIEPEIHSANCDIFVVVEGGFNAG